MTTYRHGFAGSCPFGHVAGRPDDGGYRNIFGPAVPNDIYRGLGSGREEATRAMLLRLAQHIVDASENLAAHQDNDNIPAGYTYFAQFVAHDLVQTVVQPGLGGQRNFRQTGLVLDTLYGGGPAVAPLCYTALEEGGPRVALRVGPIIPGSQGAGVDTARSEMLDLPRISLASAKDDAHPALSEVLIADPRNDDNLILAQLTALFHRLHNRIYDSVQRNRAALFPGEDPDAARCFALARGIVTLTYRRVIVQDLLQRLLCAPVYERYFIDRQPDSLLDQGTDERIPVEFSHAVFRIGHMLVRRSYKLNSDLAPARLRDVLTRVSAQAGHEFPLPKNWVIDWSGFFDPSPVNRSRLIGPSITPFLASNRKAIMGGRPGGLLHADLLRGVEGGVRRVASLIAHLPDDLRVLLGRLANPVGRATAVSEWIKSGSSLEHADRRSIINDPPLLLFVLLEAAEIENGKSLGPLGSVVVAETFARQLRRSAAMFEHQPSLAHAAEEIFGAAAPYNMPSLIKFIA